VHVREVSLEQPNLAVMTHGYVTFAWWTGDSLH
jgi:hypothetical protein